MFPSDKIYAENYRPDDIIHVLKRENLSEKDVEELNTIWSFIQQRGDGGKTAKDNKVLNQKEFSEWLSSLNYLLRMRVTNFLEKIKKNEVSVPYSPERIDLYNDIMYPEVSNMIKNEVAKHPDVKLNNVDVDYWSELILKNCREHKIPPALVISILGQETNGKFCKKVLSNNGNGAMGITTITLEDMIEGCKGNRAKYYRRLDPKLYDEIMKIAEEKYGKTPKAIRKACAEDQDLAIKIGCLVLKMKLIKSVKTRLNITSMEKAIDMFNENPNICTKEDIALAVENYNGASHKKFYSKNVMASLEMHNFDFKNNGFA